MKWLARLRPRRRDGGFLTRLARDRGGNTLAMMAAALIPIIGFSGSAVDMARLYVVKARLQQACDAGVLAGRKAMTDNADTAMPSGQTKVAMTGASATQAQTFFANNFRTGWFKNTNASFTPYKAVAGTSTAANAAYADAQTDVPMTLMRFFSAPTVTLKVSCQAIYDLADADIMFVLDTTGSMSCYPTDPTSCSTTSSSYTRADGTTGYRNPEKSATTYNGQPLYSKIESLRRAVTTFDTTMRANADPSTHFRYGFVTYSSSVNVGSALAKLPTSYLQDGSWTYQSRHLSSATGSGGDIAGDYAYGNTFAQTINVPQSSCPSGGSARIPTTGFVRSYTGLWSDEGYYQARYYTNIKYANGACSGTAQRMRAYWRYEPVAWNTASYIATLGSATGVTNPTRLDGSVTSPWRGCVEELDTSASSSFSLSSLPDDLNPDVKPTSATNKWRPLWQDVEWLRYPGTTSQDIKDDQVDESSIDEWTDYNYRPGGQLDQGGNTACGMPARRLGEMTAQDVHDYLYNTDFQPFGGTYHDVGMIWGTRMLSPDSVFGDSVAWPGRNDPTRTIVFMTDGTMSPSQYSYGQYGVEVLDNRVGSGGNSTTQYNRHVARFRIECDAAKKKGFTIYTVAVGLHGASVPDLDYCSSQGTTYFADDSQTLTAVFTTIAQRVAKLRITK